MPRSERRWRCANTQELAVYVLTHAIKEAVQGRETDVLAAIGVAWTGSSRHIHCPYSDHEDKDPSWRWDGNKDRAYCTCAKGDGILDVVMKVLGLDFSAAKVQVAEILGRKDLICRKRGERGHTPLNDTATAQRSGCTLAEYAEAKHIPAEFLTEIGLTQITYNGAPALRMPYMDISGKEVAVRYRVALQKTETGDNRFRWKKGDKPSLYGLWRMKQAYKAGYVILVEGESDCHVLWHHNIPTVGIPGATNWKEDRDAEVLDGIGTVYVVIEPDQGGGAVKKWLSNSGIRDRARMIDLGEHEDPSALCLDDPNRFEERWQAALEVAVPWQDLVAKEAEADRQDAWRQCSSLAHDAGILDRFADDIRHSGVVGEDRIAKLIFLALTSRFLDRPVSVAVKGPSSGGKSFVVEKVLSFFPDDAYHALTGMSERALAYGEEPLKHRFLVIYEAAGLQGEIGAYLIRSLLSEGRLAYEFVEKTRDGLRTRHIEREGPTGLLVTTTAIRLHPENETRLLSLTVSDTPEQTRAVLLLFAEESIDVIDMKPWHALQAWIRCGQYEVVTPFAQVLLELVPPVAVRLRRDIKAVLNLIKVHAILHQASRERDSQGRVIATMDDYAVVRDLIADLISEGVEATVPTIVRETVKAVAQLIAEGSEEVSQAQVRKVLKLDRGATSRRVAAAIQHGYLKNREDRKGRPHRLVLGEPLQEDIAILPSPEAVLQRCTVDGGDTTPSPHSSTDLSWNDEPEREILAL